MKKVQASLLVLALGATLGGCTMIHPPAYKLPSSEGLRAGKTVTVQPGDNLYTLSQRYKVKLNEIIVVNNLKPPYRVKAGDTVALPVRGGAYDAPVPMASPVPTVDKRPLGGASSGDSVTSVPLEPLTSIDGKAAPSSFDDLRAQPLPPAGPEPWTKEMRTESSVQEAPASTPPASPQDVSANADIPAFGWPVRGTIVSAFGPKGKGRDNDGINIAAPKGAPVKAAEGGTVVYADSKMKGFGNLVLIRHQAGWVTAYAHLGRTLVKLDDVVAKGDMIGSVGSTGDVGSPQLHFETRRDGKPVDPELVIR